MHANNCREGHKKCACRQLFNNGSDYSKNAPEYTTVASENLVCSTCTRDDRTGTDPVAERISSTSGGDDCTFKSAAHNCADNKHTQ